VSLIDDDHMIEAVSAYGADQPLAVGILPGRTISCFDFLHVHRLHLCRKLAAVDAVVVSKQVLRRGVPRKGLDDLLGSPTRGGILGDIEMHNSPPFMHQDDEYVKDAKISRRNCEEVDARDPFSFV